MKKKAEKKKKQAAPKKKVVTRVDTDKIREVKINLNDWCTPGALAKEFSVTRQVVNNWQNRGKLNVMQIPELGLTLVQVKKRAVLIK